MTVAEYTRLVAKIAVLKEIAMEYPTKTIENIIVQMEAIKKEIGNIAVETRRYRKSPCLGVYKNKLCY